MIWSLHYDPTTNTAHESPLATVVGCDNAAGPGTCGSQGLVGAGTNIFKIRHDIDFAAGAKPRLDPCAHLLADPRISAGACPNGGTPADQFAVLSPIMHEIQARTGHALANPGLVTLDIKGTQATNGQYLFPFGLGLGGVSIPEFVEIDLNGIATPIFFSGIPWNLDRRLSPGGCFPEGVCENSPQPLDPFPFEALDPRTQASLPAGGAGRILSFVNAGGNFTGPLAWPPIDPAATAISPTPRAVMCGGGGVPSAPNVAPVPSPIPAANAAPAPGPIPAATANVTVAAAVETLAVTQAQFRTGKNELRVTGTSSIVNGNSVSVFFGTAAAAAGTPIATVPVDPLGAFIVKASATPPAGVTQITVRSALGKVQTVGLTVRN